MIPRAFLHFLGLDSASGTAYLAWSGVLSDIAELAIVGGLIGIYRKHNCMIHGCWRIGRHPVEGTSYVTCRRHHPDGAPSHRDVLAAYGKARDAA
jgi:hypothetical protein